MIVTIDGIPVYDALITDDECGMNRISLVDAPAVESDFLAFAANKQMQLYAVQDSEKRIVRGCIMRADFPIYRRDKRGEYYVIYKADTIRIMAEKYLLESKQNLVNTMHGADTDVDGVQMVQWFIKDSANGVNPAGFEDIADGSLFAEFHVVNDEVWASIKDGTYKGFSLEGVFDLTPETDADEVQEIVDLLDGIFTKLYKDKKMSKLGKLKETLSKILMECGSVTTDKGILYWESDEDLKVGDEVFVEDEEGNRMAAPDGIYASADGNDIVIEGGIVTEIREAQPNEEPAAEEPEAEGEGEGEEPAIEPAAEPEVEAEPEVVEEVNDIEQRLAELESVVAMICEYLGIVEMSKQDKLPTLMAKMQKEIDDLKAKPMAKSAHEEVKASAEVSSTGVKGLDRLARIMKA